MSEEARSVLNKQQRKKARRKEKKLRERQAGRDLDTVTSEAIDVTLALLPLSPLQRRMRIGIEIASASEAHFIRKRINERLMVEELLDGLSVDVVEGAGTTTTSTVELWISVVA